MSKNCKKLIGSPPCTLIDHFHNEVNPLIESDPKKKVKLSVDEFAPILLGDKNKSKETENKSKKITKEDLLPTK